jgi:hypothetical protein
VKTSFLQINFGVSREKIIVLPYPAEQAKKIVA